MDGIRARLRMLAGGLHKIICQLVVMNGDFGLGHNGAFTLMKAKMEKMGICIQISVMKKFHGHGVGQKTRALPA